MRTLREPDVKAFHQISSSVSSSKLVPCRPSWKYILQLELRQVYPSPHHTLSVACQREHHEVEHTTKVSSVVDCKSTVLYTPH